MPPGTTTSPIAGHLLHAGNLHAARALACDTRAADKLEQLALAYGAGACVEVISKSVIARTHPILLLEHRDWSNPVAERPDEWKAQTLQANRALIGACALLATEVRTAVANVLKQRNAAAHFAQTPADPDQLVQDLALWLYQLRDAGVLLQPDVIARLDGPISWIRAHIAEKIAAAKAGAGKLDDLLERSADARDAQREKAQMFDAQADATVVCPACSHRASWDIEVIDVEAEYEGPGEYSLVPVHSQELRCPYCGLMLDDREIQAYDTDLTFIDGHGPAKSVGVSEHRGVFLGDGSECSMAPRMSPRPWLDQSIA